MEETNPWLDEDIQPLALNDEDIDDVVAFKAPGRNSARSRWLPGTLVWCVATQDCRDVELGVFGGGFGDPFPYECRDRAMRVDAVKGVQREVEILAEVA